MRLIRVGGAHVLCSPLFNNLLVNLSLVPKRIDSLLCLLRKIVSQEVLKLVQFHLGVNLPHRIQ